MILLKKLLFLVILLSSPSLTLADSNKMLAVVNDNYVIFEHDLQKEITFQKITNPKSLNQEQLNEKDTRILIINKMITNYLILEDSIKFKIKVTINEVNQAINYIEKTNKQPKGSLVVRAKNFGFSKSEFYLMLRNSLVVDKMKQIMSFSRAKVSNAEVDSELKRVLSLNGKGEMLLYEVSVSFKDKSQDEAEKKINTIYSHLTNGANFQEVAKKFSEDISSMNGGEIGWVPEVFLPSDVLINIRKISPNQYTKPFLVDNTYKIVLLKAVRPLLYIDINNQEHLAQLTNYAKQKILNDKAQVALEDYLKETSQKASITIYNENL